MCKLIMGKYGSSIKVALAVLVFLCMQVAAHAQSGRFDMDFDSVNDTVYLDMADSTIVCKLSTRQFRPVKSQPIYIQSIISDISEYDGGFCFSNHWMRAGYYNHFAYDSVSKNVRLVGMSRYEFGNAANDGSGESSLNLQTGEYVGDWNYYDYMRDELVSIPTIETTMDFEAVYLQDFSDDTYFEFGERCAELYYLHRDRLLALENFGFAVGGSIPLLSEFPTATDSATLIQQLLMVNELYGNDMDLTAGGKLTHYRQVKLYGSDEEFILLEYTAEEGAMFMYPWKYQLLFTTSGRLVSVLNALRFELLSVFPDQNPLLLALFSTSKGNGHHHLYKVGDSGALENIFDGLSEYFPRTYDAHDDHHINQPYELNLRVEDTDGDGFNDLVFTGNIVYTPYNTTESVRVPVALTFRYNPEAERFMEAEDYWEKYKAIELQGYE